MTEKQEYVFAKFIEIEMKKIDLDKYFQGIKIHKDPGQDYVMQWIDNNSANFRKKWEESDCKSCSHWKKCGINMCKDCQLYFHDETI